MSEMTSERWEPAYEREDDWLVHRYDLATGNVLRFCARDVRRERTGTHANLAISLNWVNLGWSNFNIERDEDRVRLANSSYKHLDADTYALDRTEFSANLFKHALDLFCMGLWDEVVGQDVGEWLCGDPNLPAAQRLLGSYVLQDAGTIIYSPPGRGKSYTALSMAVALQHGRDSVWPLTATRIPLYINLERSEQSMAARLALVNQALGLPAESGLYFLNKRGHSLSDIYEAAKRTIRLHGCDVVFFDSISRGGAGTMNADDVANKIMDMLNALGATWVALGHSPRGDESHIFGSQMFDGAADVAVQLQSQTSLDKSATGIRLLVSKANDIPTGFTSTHVIEWAPEGMAGLRRSRAGEFAELEGNRKIGIEEACIQLAARSKGSVVTAGEVANEYGLNRANVADYLSRSEQWVVASRGANNTAYYGRATARVEP